MISGNLQNFKKNRNYSKYYYLPHYSVVYYGSRSYAKKLFLIALKKGQNFVALDIRHYLPPDKISSITTRRMTLQINGDLTNR